MIEICFVAGWRVLKTQKVKMSTFCGKNKISLLGKGGESENRKVYTHFKLETYFHRKTFQSIRNEIERKLRGLSVFIMLSAMCSQKAALKFEFRNADNMATTQPCFSFLI